MELYAHTADGGNPWHLLPSHLRAVALLSARFANSFGYADTARVIGMLHDLGKAHPAFQAYLVASNAGKNAEKCPHAVWGAAWLFSIFRRRNLGEIREFTLPILCHHTGLKELDEAEQKMSSHAITHQTTDIWRDMVNFGSALLQNPPSPKPLKNAHQREMLVRMLFSCLIDADRLDTEAHFSPLKSDQRGNWTPLRHLWPIFRANQLQMMWSRRGKGEMSKPRRKVYFETLASAKLSPGLFRFTVPTGGGKTRAAMAFALRHANANRKHGFRRLIVALPYTSIVDQTAQEYRSIFGEPHVLEHHSQVKQATDTENDEGALRRELAAENWDSPIIVTTTVQLFESLLSNQTSRCRKLHRIAKSILILDEVQTLPPELLRTTLDAIKTLAIDYGVTVIFSTATQPTFEATPYLPEWGETQPVEIVRPEVRDKLFQDLDRVTYHAPREFTHDSLADELADIRQECVLAIFNTRKDALRVYRRMLSQDVPYLYHLSTLLCGEHRRSVLREITERLRSGQPVRLVSTQVVEAGVDLDFPCVYRALGPLDRIVQAAGRCNREFGLGVKGGRMVIFTLTEGATPKGPYAEGINIAANLLSKEGAMDRMSGNDIFREYYQQLFRAVNPDKLGIQDFRERMDYPKVAESYRFIEPTEQFVIASPPHYTPIVEPLIARHQNHPTRHTWRALQPFVVNLMKWEAEQLREGNAELISEGLWRWNGKYDRQTHCGIDAQYDTADLIVP